MDVPGKQVVYYSSLLPITMEGDVNSVLAFELIKVAAQHWAGDQAFIIFTAQAFIILTAHTFIIFTAQALFALKWILTPNYDTYYSSADAIIHNLCHHHQQHGAISATTIALPSSILPHLPSPGSKLKLLCDSSSQGNGAERAEKKTLKSILYHPASRVSTGIINCSMP